MASARTAWRAGGVAAMLAGAALAGCGCSTTARGGIPEIRVQMTGSDRFAVGEHTSTLADLPALLKKSGAGPATSVVVLVPDRTPPATMAAIGGKLTSAGHRKVMLQKPRRAEAHLGPDASRKTK